MSNAAIGVGVTGSDLHLRSLRAGSGITLTQNVDEVVIDAVAGFGGITGVSNDDGGGSVDGQIFKNIVSGVAHLRTVKAGSNVSITQDADTITISSTAGSGGGSSNTFSNVGLGSGVYRDISGSNVNLRSIAAGSGISGTENANEIVISTTGGSGGGGTASGFNEYNNGSVYSAGQIITKDGTIYRAKTSTSTSFEYEEWDNLSDPSHDKNVESKGTRLSTALTIGNYYDVNFGIGNAFKDAGTEVILWPDRDGERALAAGQVCVFRKPRVYGHEYSDDAPNIQDYGSGGL
jgi:hypothetical protein